MQQLQIILWLFGSSMQVTCSAFVRGGKLPSTEATRPSFVPQEKLIEVSRISLALKQTPWNTSEAGSDAFMFDTPNDHDSWLEVREEYVVDVFESKSLEEDDSNEDDNDYDEGGTDEGEADVSDKLLKEYQSYSQAVNVALRALERKQNSLQLELAKAKDVEKMVTRAQLILSNLYLFTKPSIKTVTVQDWENGGEEIELSLSSQYDSALAESDALFTQARKLKRGSLVISKLVQETEGAFQLLRDAQDKLTACFNGAQIDEVLFNTTKELLCRTSSKTKFEVPNDSMVQDVDGKKSNARKQQRTIAEQAVRRMKSPGGCIVLVGRNRRGNEHLSFQVARGKDLWMHARGCPGAHVLLQHRRGSPEPTQECLEFCANLAVFYSDARNERKASVTVADPKHILKPRGAPLGAVKLREEMYVLTGYPDKVPEELKLARDESGQTDEFRAQDKAKRRKRTLEVAQQEQVKRREERSNKRKTKRQGSSLVSESDSSFDPI